MSLLTSFLATRTNQGAEAIFLEWETFCRRHAIDPGSFGDFRTAYCQVLARQNKAAPGRQRPYQRSVEGL